jgi:hypothetical protein
MKKIIPVLCTFLVSSCGGPANEPTNSDGVSASEHRIFITSTTTDGAMTGGVGATGIDKADNLCQTAADNAGLIRDYKAIISTSDNKANQRIIISGAIYTIAGSNKTKIAESSSDFWSASTTNLLNPINRDEIGNYVTNATAWTGTDEEGNGTNEDCADWSTNSTGTGDYGDNDEVTDAWVESTTPDNCSNSKRLYCISQ